MGNMYGIMRVEKRKRQAVYGIEVENNRDAGNPKNFVASDIDWQRTHENRVLVRSDSWNEDIKNIIDKAGAKVRADSVVMLDGIYTASPEFFKICGDEEIEWFFDDCLKFHEEHYGKVFNAVIHYDESTPHLHVVSVPITEDGRLSAKDIMGNRQKYHELQDAFYRDVSRHFLLERGEVRDNAEKRKHLDNLTFKAEQTHKQAEEARKQAEISHRESAAALAQRDKAKEETKEYHSLPERERQLFYKSVDVDLKSKDIEKREHELTKKEREFRERYDALVHLENMHYTKEDVENAKIRERKKMEQALEKVSPETREEFVKAYREVSKSQNIKILKNR